MIIIIFTGKRKEGGVSLGDALACKGPAGRHSDAVLGAFLFDMMVIICEFEEARKCLLVTVAPLRLNYRANGARRFYASAMTLLRKDHSRSVAFNVERAEQVLEEVAGAVDGWQDAARKAGIARGDAELTAGAFSAHSKYRATPAG